MNPRARGDDDDETSETSASRSDEDAFEDVRATDGFEDEEIDEDEAFNEEDEERFGEAFADDDDAYAVDAFDGAEEDARGERGENDDDLNALMDSDEDEGSRGRSEWHWSGCAEHTQCPRPMSNAKCRRRSR